MNHSGNGLLLLSILLSLIFAPRVRAASEVELFPGGELDMLAPAQQTFHQNFQKEGDYSESWFSMVQTADGGVLMALLAVTNLGPRTFDSALDVQFYAADGSSYNWHEEYRKSDLKAAADKLDLQIGPHRLVATADGYRYSLKSADYSLDLLLQKELPSFQQGGGRVLFHADSPREWAISMLAPRAVSGGSFKARGKSYNLQGRAYFDHSWATIKIPSMADSWVTLRLMHPDFTAIIHQITMTRKFQHGAIKLAVIGDNKKIYGSSTLFDLKVLNSRKDAASGKYMANKFAIDLTSNGYRLTGTIKEARFLESIDALGQLNGFTRGLIKAFYAKPTMIRWWADCDLKLTAPDGSVKAIKGPAVMETNYYR